MRQLLVLKHRACKSIAEQRECLFLICLAILAGGPEYFSAEHRVVDTCQEWCVLSWSGGQGQTSLGKAMGCIKKVYLVEHAAAVVCGKALKVVSAILSALCHEAPQVGHI